MRSNRAAILFTILLGGLCVAADTGMESTAEQYYTANALYNRKLYTAAIPEYKAFLKQYPQHAKSEQARLGLALSCFGSGGYAEAEPLFAALSTKGEAVDKAQVTVLLGQCQLKTRGPAQAEAAFASAVTAPGAPEYRNTALALLADVCFQQGKWSNTISAADGFIKAEPKGVRTGRVGYQGAFARYQLGRIDEAIETLTWLTPLVQGTALQTRAAFLLGEALRVSGRMEKAAEQYAAAATNETGMLAAEAFFRLGYADFQLKRYDGAFTALVKSIGLQPQAGYSDEARLYAGRAALEKQDYKAALPVLQALSEATNAVSGDATLWLARVYSRQGKFADAGKVLLDKIPRFRAGKSGVLPDLLYDGAVAMMAQQKYDEAGNFLDELERLGPRDDRRVEILRLHATALHYARQYAKSLEYSSRFLTLTQTNAAVPSMNEILFLHAENHYLVTPPLLDAALQAFRDYLRVFPAESNADAATLRVSQILYRKGEWAASLKVAEPLSAKKPEGRLFNQLLFMVGDCHFRLANWPSALTHLTAFAGKAGPDELNVDTALLEMALSAQQSGQAELAMTHLSRLLASHPKSEHIPLALAELGRLKYEAKQYKPAATALKQLVTTYPNSTEKASGDYYLGWIALKEGRDQEAERYFGAVVAGAPGNPLCADSLLQLGLLGMKAGTFPEALARMQALLKQFPDFAGCDEALYCSGVALSRQKRWSEAVNASFQPFTNRFANSPLMDRVLYEWAWCERNQKRIPAAVKLYGTLLQACPQSPLLDRARFEMSELTFDAKQYESSIADLKRSVDTVKDPALREQVMNRLAWAYLSKGDPDAAAAAFEAVLAEFPNSESAATAHYQAGECRLKLLEYQAARDHFAAALTARNAQDVAESALLRLGEANGLLKQWPESSKAYDQFQKAHPASRWIRHARLGSGWARENQKEYEAAIVQYRKVTAEKGADDLAARCQFQIGECLFALGRHDEAVQEFMRLDVTCRYPEWNAKALLELGRVLETKGDKTGAIARFKELIQRYPKDNAALVAKERLDALRL